MTMRIEGDKLKISFLQVKAPEERPWRSVKGDVEEQKNRKDWLKDHINTAKKQLLKDAETFFQVVPDVTAEDFSKFIDIDFFVSFPEASSADWEHEAQSILFKGIKITLYLNLILLLLQK